jgi:hypothetical protein
MCDRTILKGDDRAFMAGDKIYGRTTPGQVQLILSEY